MSSQGLHQTCKVDMLETFEISLFGSQDLNKNNLKQLFYIPKAAPGPYKVGTQILLVVPGRPKRSEGAPRDSQGTPRTTR